MKFSYSAVWNDAAAMLKRNGSLLLAIAGVFFLLPSLLLGYFAPAPTGSGQDALNAMMGHYRENLPWIVLAQLVNLLGGIAVYKLLFDQREGTVGTAIGGALPILPMYFIMTVISSMAIGMGLVFLLLPGIYLLGRLVIAGAAMVAEGHRSPIAPIRSSWNHTRRRGWAVAGLVIIVAIAGLILSFVITAILGSVFLLIGGREGVGPLLVLILNSALTAALQTVLIVLFAAIYRALSGAAEPTTGI
ncbi:MAG: hypothetical protein AVDCRST_MAG23-291 [uncultured Sphingosinicella sp.]|uniref:Glycerophosphoryl diester phosphodiesterase membrane domain-containing protein n=1 Tax=uncultured Sphingosinicella sp. TaxID=478748 RepID=A0A6J4TK49_9SPHN|nr:hypothetical protein [uncultured Sphingosinicella sp.]CAA9524125.1 MAG: hypothetical protein AVDCRST_MAG23-291 [uncultured Sphingosinicella sp.]